ncbi:MAG: hypothetical protein J7K73_01215 [Nanoarchaeota archaeon]|nr:hypothetical protein [Nanoarchaeota archaeon]
MFWDFWIEEFDEKLLQKLGFEGACVFGEAKGRKIKILKGEKIIAKNGNELKKKTKSRADFLMLTNTKERLQRIAIKRCLVDGVHGFVKYPLIKEMAEKNIAVVISFNDLLKSKEPQKTIAKMKQTIKLAKKYKTPIVIVSGAKNKWELRGTSELIAFGEILGLQRNEAKKALYEFQDKIAERQKLKKEGKYVMPGVKIISKD